MINHCMQNTFLNGEDLYLLAKLVSNKYIKYFIILRNIYFSIVDCSNNNNNLQVGIPNTMYLIDFCRKNYIYFMINFIIIIVYNIIIINKYIILYSYNLSK